MNSKPVLQRQLKDRVGCGGDSGWGGVEDREGIAEANEEGDLGQQPICYSVRASSGSGNR